MKEALEKMQAMLEASWNATDGALAAAYEDFCEEHKGERFDIGCGYRVTAPTKFTHTLSVHERSACRYGREWYEKQNAKNAKKFVESLEARVTAITGPITDWAVSETRNSLSSYLVRGEKGTAKVSQIFAGGYNIVRLHIRNLIRKIKVA